MIGTAVCRDKERMSASASGDMIAEGEQPLAQRKCRMNTALPASAESYRAAHTARRVGTRKCPLGSLKTREFGA